MHLVADGWPQSSSLLGEVSDILVQAILDAGLAKAARSQPPFDEAALHV